ncbi:MULTISPECIES: hypothetical protein [unclassified Amycolatopsis]|uniref:hypothetical protein n=1 Tax=unclassified Amycolatopsis TaxID=2618356 RepID=UPI0028757CDA|nr:MULTISPECIES: hypothetical protein [unclassified Amycolatopsis]MDS0137809.1 hypothetical protein [Amycolatopsis sp. 505]MDS0144278.1 hypothetical protein [Amycolatopsis sp. CM201R]
MLDDLRANLLGQVALARRTARHLPAAGSITLTGGTFTEPIPGSGLGALVNAGAAGRRLPSSCPLIGKLCQNPRAEPLSCCAKSKNRFSGVTGDRVRPTGRSASDQLT